MLGPRAGHETRSNRSPGTVPGSEADSILAEHTGDAGDLAPAADRSSMWAFLPRSMLTLTYIALIVIGCAYIAMSFALGHLFHGDGVLGHSDSGPGDAFHFPLL